METDSNPLIIKDPLQPGYSIGHIDITAGTFGAVVSKMKELFILSNSHVLAKSGIGKKGDPILYPGKADQDGRTDNLIGHLEDFVQFTKGGEYVNNVDCAIARPTAAGLAILTSEIKGLGIPKGTTKPVRGMKVIKVGRTTGKTTGEIKDVHFRTLLDYDFGVGSIGFTDQVFCTRYSSGGDSGSLVLEESTMMAVGLHFSGSSGGEHSGSIFNPIDKVLTALGVELVTMPIDKNKAKIESAKVFRAAKTNKPGEKKTKKANRIVTNSVISKTKRGKEAKNKVMITENEANLARENHSEYLRKLGAHSIGVDEIEKDGKKTFAVVAYSKQKIQNLPNELEVSSGNNTSKVPLISKIADPFKLE